MSAGYSATPLLKKLGVKPGQDALLVNTPDDLSELSGFREFASLTRADTAPGEGGPYDYIHVSCPDSSALEAAVKELPERLEPAGMMWISWPKKSSGVETDIDGAAVRRAGCAAGLVDIKVCAVDETWSGLKFVIPVKDRPGESR